MTSGVYTQHNTVFIIESGWSKMRYELTSHKLFYRLFKPIFLCGQSLQEQDCLLHSRGYSVFSIMNRVTSPAAGQKYTYRILACSREYTFHLSYLVIQARSSMNVSSRGKLIVWIVWILWPTRCLETSHSFLLLWYIFTEPSSFLHSYRTRFPWGSYKIGKFQAGNIIHLTHLQFCLPFRNNYPDHLKTSKNLLAGNHSCPFPNTKLLCTRYSMAGFPGDMKELVIKNLPIMPWLKIKIKKKVSLRRKCWTPDVQVNVKHNAFLPSVW